MPFELSGVLSLANVLGQRYVEPVLHDGVLRNDPTAAMLKRKCLKPYRGGTGWQQNATYDLMEVLSVPRSNVSYPTSTNTHQVEQGWQFGIKSYLVPLSVDLDQLTTDLWGQNVNLDYLETRLQLGALSLSAQIATDVYKDGQQASRLLKPNGLDEALNDGSTAGWQGVSFADYGTIARSTTAGEVTKSPMTGPTANFAGTSLTLKGVSDAWDSIWYGDMQCDYMVTSIRGFGILRRTIYNPATRLEREDDPEWGFTSMVFNGTRVFASQYVPGSRPATAADTKIGYSAITGESLWFLNTNTINFYVTTNPTKAFALWPFQMLPGTGQAVAQYRADININVNPGQNRFNRYIFGFTD